MFHNWAVDKFVYDWNLKFPIDRWWRQKHQIPFNSPVHRESCFIDMYFEFLEDRFWEKMSEEKEKEVYKPGTGDFLKKREWTEEEVNRAFDNIDLSKFDGHNEKNSI